MFRSIAKTCATCPSALCKVSRPLSRVCIVKTGTEASDIPHLKRLSAGYIRREAEIAFGVVVANSFDQLPYCVLVVRILAIFYPTAERTAQKPSEIFVTRIRCKTSGICRHADELTENTIAGESFKVL